MTDDRSLKYYDKDCKPITMDEYIKLLSDESYKIIQQDLIDESMVSTVWLGFDISIFGTDRPLIFETMIFCEDKSREIHNSQWRYTNMSDALKGHAAAIEMAKTGV